MLAPARADSSGAVPTISRGLLEGSNYLISLGLWRTTIGREMFGRVFDEPLENEGKGP